LLQKCAFANGGIVTRYHWSCKGFGEKTSKRGLVGYSSRMLKERKVVNKAKGRMMWRAGLKIMVAAEISHTFLTTFFLYRYCGHWQ